MTHWEYFGNRSCFAFGRTTIRLTINKWPGGWLDWLQWQAKWDVLFGHGKTLSYFQQYSLYYRCKNKQQANLVASKSSLMKTIHRDWVNRRKKNHLRIPNSRTEKKTKFIGGTYTRVLLNVARKKYDCRVIRYQYVTGVGRRFQTNDKGGTVPWILNKTKKINHIFRYWNPWRSSLY